MAFDEHPDRRAERWEELDEEDFMRERREDRLGDYQGFAAVGGRPGQCAQGPRLTTAMTVLARTVIEGPDYDRRDAARVLAELVLEAGE